MNAAPADVKTARILVIDDNPIIQRTLYFVLRDQGYKVFLSGEIAEAMNLVRKEKPNLILLDINFPPDGSITGGAERDGFWALEWMRRMDEVKGVPIVMISSAEPASASPRAHAAGAAGYLHKPINKDNLILTVAELLKSNPPPELQSGLLLKPLWPPQ
jgi:CheY-like chemotaxis protein